MFIKSHKLYFRDFFLRRIFQKVLFRDFLFNANFYLKNFIIFITFFYFFRTFSKDKDNFFDEFRNASANATEFIQFSVQILISSICF